MKNILLTLVLITTLNVHSQVCDKIERSFILYFIIEDIIIIENTQFNNREYNSDLVKLEYSTLGDYYTDIIFYSFKVGSNNISAITENLEIKFNSSFCGEYILGFNTVTGESFRLKGFNGNDLFFLLKSLDGFFGNSRKINSILRELNELNINVNFKELYRDLKKNNFKANSLKACSEPSGI